MIKKMLKETTVNKKFRKTKISFKSKCKTAKVIDLKKEGKENTRTMKK